VHERHGRCTAAKITSYVATTVLGLPRSDGTVMAQALRAHLAERIVGVVGGIDQRCSGS
jgi:hypothetical protein